MGPTVGDFLDIGKGNFYLHMGVNPKIVVPPKNGWFYNGSKPYEQIDDLGGFPIIFGKPVGDSSPFFFLQTDLVMGSTHFFKAMGSISQKRAIRCDLPVFLDAKLRLQTEKGI